jgi:hypothetical protein
VPVFLRGGRAAAQVVMAPVTDALADLATTTVFAPMQTMLSLWQTALRV